MSYKTVHDVLKTLQQRYADVAVALDAAEIFAHSDDAKAAIAALRRDERRVAEAMGDSADDRTQSSNQTWLQFASLEEVDRATEGVIEACRNATTLEDMEEAKIDFDEAVEGLVSNVAGEVQAPSVAERLQSLAEYFASRTRQESWSQRRE